MQSLSSELVQVAGALASILGLLIAGQNVWRSADIDLLMLACYIGVALGAMGMLALLLMFGIGILVGALAHRYLQQQVES